jgi:hypothetical protein
LEWRGVRGTPLCYVPHYERFAPSSFAGGSFGSNGGLRCCVAHFDRVTPSRISHRASRIEYLIWILKLGFHLKLEI